MRSLLLWSLLIVYLDAADGLQWQPRRHELHPSWDQERVTAVYRVHNAGETAWRISDVHASCDCASATADTQELPPGGDAAVTVVFDTANRVGLQRKEVLVTLEDADGRQQRERLELLIHIPEPVRLDRSVLFWRRGGPATSQTVTVSIDEPWVLAPVADLPEGFTLERQDADPRRIRFIVTPAATDQARMHRLRIRSDHPSPDFNDLPLVLMIK